MLSDDGKRAIVEITGANLEVLEKAIESHRESSQVLDPSKSEKTSAEDELRAVKRDFRWEDLTGFGAVAPGSSDKGVKPTGAVSRDASERAAVNYYYTDNFSSINPSSLASGSSALTRSDPLVLR